MKWHFSRESDVGAGADVGRDGSAGADTGRSARADAQRNSANKCVLLSH